MNKLIKEMEEYAILNNIPIMVKDTIKYINEIIEDYVVKDILEIGTAIGYSTIMFAKNKDVKITSIERDELRYNLAEENVKKSKLNNIKLIYGDALSIELINKYDLIIIDAAKSQNINFFEKYKENLRSQGVIIIDNMNFHGLVHSSNKIESRNLRQMVSKLEKFLDYIDSQEDFNVEHLDIGDGIVVCVKNF